jgi:hypothetical protein
MVFLDCTILILRVNQVRTSQNIKLHFLFAAVTLAAGKAVGTMNRPISLILKLLSHLTLVRCFFEPLRISSSDFLLFMDRKFGDVGEDTSGLTMAECPSQ